MRVIPTVIPDLAALKLPPQIADVAHVRNGIVLVTGGTSSGKSSTLAALIQEINLTDTRHIVTVESPIEYMFRPRKAYIRQREVGRDTPSFEQALLDALREDPDVLMVGEMRDPETMRLTLNASETGHLVLATVHSSTCAEALQRVVSAFPAEIQSSVSAQLADSLVAVIAQRLRFRPEVNIRVPECEILVATHAVKNFVRNRDFFKIISAIEAGGEHGMWSYQRYRTWLDSRTEWHIPDESPEPPDTEPAETPVRAGALTSSAEPSPVKSDKSTAAPRSLPVGKSAPRIEIEPIESEFGKILKRPGTTP